MCKCSDTFSLRVLIGRGLKPNIGNVNRVRYSILREYVLLVGVDSGEGPPVPIPNTVVKLTGVENTWLVTARKDR